MKIEVKIEIEGENVEEIARKLIEIGRIIEPKVKTTEKTEVEKELLKDLVEATIDYTTASLPPRRGRRPEKAIRRWVSEVIRTGKTKIPAERLPEKTVSKLQKWGIVRKVRSEGNGYILVPDEGVERIVKQMLVGVVE